MLKANGMSLLLLFSFACLTTSAQDGQPVSLRFNSRSAFSAIAATSNASAGATLTSSVLVLQPSCGDW